LNSRIIYRKINIIYIPILPNMGGDPKPKLFDWPTIAGLPNPVLAVAPNPEFGTPKPVLGVLEQIKLLCWLTGNVNI